MFRQTLRTTAIFRPTVLKTSIRRAPAVLLARAAFPSLSQKRLYHEKVLDHYANPRNVGTLDKNDASVGTGLVGAPACGDVMRMQIKVDEATGVISDVKFKTFGCGSAIASSSYVTELVKGKTLEEALKLKNTAIAKELSLPPVKLHCSMLAEDAIKSAVKDYKSKRANAMSLPTLGATN
ncbi:hypothetical protein METBISCDRAFT_17321 [Metschnikowia bicuspidata]|uniref:Iron-sulfur cluster assembly protein n=1 Tax=Metschnikowia bicuspidata TaxID=27322 RepID=A0A4P9ZAY5_9ASCO|nr:hypothetical protein METBISCDRAFT_17321 [Metschnikowia bicuspidata]